MSRYFWGMRIFIDDCNSSPLPKLCKTCWFVLARSGVYFFIASSSIRETLGFVLSESGNLYGF